MEISIGGGGFTDIIDAGGSFVTNGYTETISTCCLNPLAGRLAWSGNSGGFITTIVNLPAAAAGQIVQFRWRFGTDEGTGAGGWYVDTISLSDGFECCSGAYVTSDVAIGQTASAPVVNVGSNATFIITVTNLGLNIASDVVVTSTLPPELSFVSATASQGVWATNGAKATSASAAT